MRAHILTWSLSLVSPPIQKMKVFDISFTLLDVPYCGEPAPLYIPMKLNGQIVMDVMVDHLCRVYAIIEETLFVNEWHGLRYDECRATLRTHNGPSLSAFGSIILMVLVGPKAIWNMFVIILESDLFYAKLGIPWLVDMDAIPSVIHKCLKFLHEGWVCVVQDSGSPWGFFAQSFLAYFNWAYASP